ncbi:MAG: 1-acyl-sn-glycerol-3-phosphate acyltransferase [Candidatus Nanopelagicales bacterium]
MLANLVYRDIDLHLPDEPLPDGPVLAVANHFGGLADGVLLVDSLPRMPRVVARDVIWRIPVVGRLFSSLGGIPVHRPADSGPVSNETMFGSCYEALRLGDLVLIFPEGVTQDVPHMAEVRTGAARIALGARASGARGVHVLPIGLHYEDKAGFRSRVLVNVGDPIDLDAWVSGRPGPSDADDRDAVRDLTTHLDARLRHVAPDFPDWATAHSLDSAADVLLHDVDPSSREIRYGERELLSARMNRLPGTERARLVDAGSAYRARLRELRTSDFGVLRGGARDRRAWDWLLDVLVVVLLAPFALAGLLAAAVPLAAVVLLSRAPLAPAVRATLVPGVALLGFMGEWLISVWQAQEGFGWAGALVSALVFPMVVASFFLVHEHLALLIRRWRSRKRPGRAERPALEELRAELSSRAWAAL